MTDLFSQTLDVETPELDPTKNYLDELVGEGKKFSDPASLARGKAEADMFIERLKTEMSGLRTELNSRVKMEEFLDKLNSVSSQKQSPEDGQQPPDQTKVEGLKREDALKLWDDREKQKIATHNVNQVKSKLEESFGPNYATKLKSVANTLGLSTDHLNNLASTSPEAFYKLVGIGEVKQDLFQAPSRTQVNTQGFKPSSTGERDWDYYEGIRKKEPTKYWSTTVQNQMHSDARRLGDAFKK